MSNLCFDSDKLILFLCLGFLYDSLHLDKYTYYTRHPKIPNDFSSRPTDSFGAGKKTIPSNVTSHTPPQN
jgi:hypothetical protein